MHSNHVGSWKRLARISKGHVLSEFISREKIVRTNSNFSSDYLTTLGSVKHHNNASSTSPTVGTTLHYNRFEISNTLESF